MNNEIQLFENQTIRTAWNEEIGEFYFSIEDVVAVLSESSDPKQYIKRMRSRDTELSSNWGTICTQVEMIAKDGKKRKIMAATTQGVLRIVQSIPSKKAEPFKLWLAQVGRERIEETIDPELTIERALENYRKKGYTREWINQRLQAIQVRKELTDEWQNRGVRQGIEYAILTDEITRAWSGMSTKQYKKLKGLKKENLRDNMSTLELVLNMLAEATTTEISKQQQPETFADNIRVARSGGEAAGEARSAVEKRTGLPVISSKNAAQLNSLVTNLIESVVDEEKG
ncbi:MAG: phage antirepressor protein [Clostridia bacterium]|nr:phage antirepressor protein [Clostridia bacterium]MBR6634363.1 phage antirepressor protein [Clostridia bacterium]